MSEVRILSPRPDFALEFNRVHSASDRSMAWVDPASMLFARSICAVVAYAIVVA
jgi:hypothetical protein